MDTRSKSYLITAEPFALFQRRFISILSFLIFSCATASAQNIECKDLLNIAEMEQTAFQQMLLPEGSASVGDNYDLKYHRLVWEVAPTIFYIKGKITSYFVPVTNVMNTMDFDLTDTLLVDSVIFHATKQTFTRNANQLKITLSLTLNKGTLDSVSVFYHGRPNASGMGSFVVSTHAGSPVLWTLSEPNGAKDWWPCKQSLNDKIDSIDIVVTTPKTYRVASNGLLISEVTNGNNKVYHWQSHYPIAAYLIAIAVTNYDVYKDYLVLSNNDTLQLLNYLYHEDSATVSSLLKIKGIIKLYDSLTILYPFRKEKYGHAQFGWGGGMEHQTMSFIQGYSMPLIAHECAHQWFGDKITCASWSDIWLNEGFATYLEALTEEFLLPPASFTTWKKNARTSITSAPGGSVYCPDTLNVSRIFSSRLSYNKGAYLLHMLRWKMGDSLFFLSLKNYLNDPKLSYGYAKTSDLKAHLEQTSGQNLTNFFNQWFYGEGYPSYQIECAYSPGNMKVKINQTTSHTSVSFYEMPVPIRFQAAGRDTTIIFNHTTSGQIFNSPLNFKPSTITFDPKMWLLSAADTLTSSNVGIATFLEDYFNLNIFPNPTNQLLHISGKFAAQNGTIFLKNILGETVYQRNVFFNEGDNRFEIDLTRLSKGLYTLEISDEKQFSARKVVKK